MDLDKESQEALFQLTLKMSESAAPLLLVESHSNWKELPGIVVGFKKALRKLKYITDKQLLNLSDEEYKALIESHDFLLAIDIPSNVKKLSYFPLEMRNEGAFTMAMGTTEWINHNYDVFVTMEMPGVLPHMIRILSNRGQWSR